MSKTKGCITPTIRYSPTKEINYEKLKELIKLYPEKTNKELGEYFSMSATGILYALRKLKIVLKKDDVL